MPTGSSDEAAAAARASRSSNGYLLLGIVLTLLPWPYAAAALIPLAMAVFGTARAMLALRRLGAPRPLRVSTAVSLGLTVLLMLTIAVPLLGESDDLRTCLSGANTRTATQSCPERFGGDGVWGSLF